MEKNNQSTVLANIVSRLLVLEKKMKLQESSFANAQKLIKEQRVHITQLRKSGKKSPLIKK